MFAVDGKAGTFTIHLSLASACVDQHNSMYLKGMLTKLFKGAWLTVERINSQDADPLSMMVHTSDPQVTSKATTNRDPTKSRTRI